MNSLILQTATRFLQPLFVLFSLFLLLRGHNIPGGGFTGGLVAASAFVLHVIAYDVPSARRVLRMEPHGFIGIGLLLAVGSGLWSALAGEPFLTGKWAEIDVPGLGSLHLGTPLLFDIGVYLVVLGVTLTIIFSLAEE